MVRVVGMSLVKSVRLKVRKFWDLDVRSLVLIILVMMPLRSAVADWNWVPTGSMKPTILEGDMVFVNKLAYDLKVPFTLTRLAEWRTPKHEDIVVFFSPHDSVRLVKRVVGCPGDRIELRNNVVYRNGESLASEPKKMRPQGSLAPEIFEDSQPLLSKERGETQSHWTLTLPNRAAMRNFGPIVVPDGQYFMMGDSRDNSHDSRFFGCVDQKLIVGKAEGILLSVDKNRTLLPRIGRFLTSLYGGV